jgi:hypothetical protein
MEIRVKFFNTNDVNVQTIKLEIPNNLTITNLTNKIKEYAPMDATYFRIFQNEKVKSTKINL